MAAAARGGLGRPGACAAGGLGRSGAGGAGAVAGTRPARPLWVARAAGEEDDSLLGLGELGDIMEAASGDSTSLPDWLPDSPETRQVFKLLQGEDMGLTKKILVEKYGETLYQWSGWGKEAELLNGRAAMVGFLAGTGAIFLEGDVLTQLAKHPLWTLGVIVAIAQAQVIAAEKPAGTAMIPDSVKQPVLDAYVNMGGEKFFSSEAEKANGRAAMIGMLILLFFSALF